jgi:uncharacterized protein (DUF1800 family)
MHIETRFPTLKVAVVVLLTLQAGFPAGFSAQQMQSSDAKSMSTGKKVSAVQPIKQDEKLLMVLDRFTYGPRPGDLERLRTIGVKAWFSQQLDPKSIDDSAMDARLAKYPAMQMPLEKLMEAYPTNQMVKQAMNGNLSVPSGEAERAIYADQEERYREKLTKDKATKNAKPADADMMAKGGDDGNTSPLPIPVASLLALPPDQRFKQMCHLNLAQLRELRKELLPAQRGLLVEGMTPVQMEAIVAFAGPERLVGAEDIQVKLLRDVYSERQLQEVMIDFWLNHFNVYMKKSQQAPYYISAYEREAIRPFALGKFENLLISTASSPAMLNYLDNSESVGPNSQFAQRPVRFGQNKPKDSGLNENYARELMELHTVGVGGGYTQKDVTEVAKVFTGWTVDKGYKADTPAAQAEYDASKHEPGDKLVMGQKIKWQGEPEGIQVLKMLAESPQCAKFISTKLAVRFVSDTPPPAMIDRMSRAFLDSNGDIRQVLAAMVNSPEFFTSVTYRAKLKTPQDFVLSAVRAAGSHVDNVAGLETAISDLGMPVYGMQTPQGYSMKADAWNSTSQLVQRMNFAMALATDRVVGVHTDATSLLGPNAGGMTAEEKANWFEAELIHAPMSARTQQSILTQVQMDGTQQAAELKQVAAIRGRGEIVGLRGDTGVISGATGVDTQAVLAVGLILGSPEFQRR